MHTWPGAPRIIWSIETKWPLLHCTIPLFVMPNSLKSDNSSLVPFKKNVLSIMHVGQRNNTFPLMSSLISPGHSSLMRISTNFRADWRNWYPPASCQVLLFWWELSQVTTKSMKLLSGERIVKSSHWWEGTEILANWVETSKSVVPHMLTNSAWMLQKRPDGKMQKLLGVKCRTPMTPICRSKCCLNWGMSLVK